MKYRLQPDQEIFRRSKHSRWSVRSEEYTMPTGLETYASHHRCPQTSKAKIGERTRVKNNWSWFVDDSPVCYGCGCAVPDYIQALVRLQMGE